MQKILTTGQVAKLCKVAPRVVSRWFDSGRLRGYRIPGSQDRRIPVEQLLRFLRECNMPIPVEIEPVVPDVPVVTLSTGVRVANFSSPHSFTFTDGRVLAACRPERARELMLESREIVHRGAEWNDVELEFLLSPSVGDAVSLLEADSSVDVILVPLPVLQALKYAGRGIGKCRTCRVADRVTKTIHHDRFCI